MGFILIPENGEDNVYINAWNWRPTILFLLEQGVIDEQKHTMLGCQFGESVDEAASIRIADAVASKLEQMAPGQRMRGDLRITSEPKETLIIGPDGDNGVPDEEVYSATYEWLVTLEQFSRNSGGFKVY